MMKKTLLFAWLTACLLPIASLAGTRQAHEETTPTATLLHDDTSTLFYGENALQQAMEQAVNGDVISLSAGTFLGCDITSAVTIRGVAYLDEYPDIYAPLLKYTTPTDGATDVPFCGQIVLQFDEPILLAEGARIYLNGMELMPQAKGDRIVCDYAGLNFKEGYTCILPANSVTDLVGNAIGEDISFSFTVAEHPVNAILPYGQFSQEPWTAKGVIGENPYDNWYTADFDDSGWDIITGPISSQTDYGLPYYNTLFPLYNAYWLRRHFTMNDVDNTQQYMLYVAHDDDCAVWLNGLFVANLPDWTSGAYVTVPVDPSFLQEGDNVLAVTVRDCYGGDAYIDFGLYTDADITAPNGSITTDKQQYVPNDTVRISGTATGTYALTTLDVTIEGNGVKQVIPTTTDAQGAFTAEWVPMSGQTGRFTISVSSQGYDIVKKHARIDVVGLRLTSTAYITCQTTVDEPYTAKIVIENPGNVQQKLKRVEVLSKPDNCEVACYIENYTMPAGRKVTVNCNIKGSAPSPGTDWEQIVLRISTEEGATLDVTLYYYCRSSKGVLAADKDKISTTMTLGAQRDYPITIANRGKGETGTIRLSLPNVAWMTAATPVEMPSLATGEEGTIILRLQPTDGMPLNVPQTGTIGVNCDNGDGLAIAYSIEAVSQQTGTLTIDAVDEYTEFTAEKPHVANATVEVKHPTTGAIIAQGKTATDGKFSCELPEGYYTVSVTADKHDSYTATLLVDPGRELLHEAFISFQAISYSYTMEETEIEDQYNIVTTVTYETNVPKPVLHITLPTDKPGPNEVFPIVVTNQGLISAVHVEMHPYITPGFAFEILNPEPIDELKAQESYTYYGVIKCDEEIWEGSCIKAWVVVDGYFIYRDGMKPVDTQIAYIYNCNRQGQTPVVNDDTTWPVVTPPVPPIGGSTVTGGSGGGDVTPWTTTESFPVETKLQIEQVMVLKRPAYRGTLLMKNGHDTTAMTDVRLNMVIKDEDGNVATDEQFQVAVESLDQFQGELSLTDGWTLGAQQTGTAKILFIPTKLAAPTKEKAYTFSGTLTCTDPFTGLQLTLPLYPHTFTVRPLPELELTYLMQRDVYGDDPLTSNVTEPSVPAEFALIINNKGNGQAKDVRMQTEQPKIVENESGLLLSMEIVKSQVNGDPAQLVLSPTIANKFGNIAAHKQAYAQWWLRSSLLGHFTAYAVEATHVTNYGNANLSLVDTVTIHEMTHGFTEATTQKAARRGYLVNDKEDANDQPDIIYFTDATQEGVRTDANAAIGKQDDGYLLTLGANEGGWYYGSLPDPTDGQLVVASVVRQSDGAVLPTDNVWQTSRTLLDGVQWLYENRLHFVALLPQGGDSYLLTFSTASAIHEVTTTGGLHVRLTGDWLYADGDFSEARTVEVYDMRGLQRVHREQVLPRQGVYTGHLPAGIYHVVVTTEKGTTYRAKVLKR